MDNFPIALERVLFTRSVVIALPDHKGLADGIVKHQPVNEIDIALIEPPNRYIATMRTRINPESDPADPYCIDMECIGIFVVDEKELDPEEAKRGLTITAHSVLYGAIRESLAWITGRAAHGPFLLGLSVLQRKPDPTEAENKVKKA